MKKHFSTPSQDDAKRKIHAGESSLNSLLLSRDSGLIYPTLDDEIAGTRKKLAFLKKGLKRKIDNAENQ